MRCGEKRNKDNLVPRVGNKVRFFTAEPQVDTFAPIHMSMLTDPWNNKNRYLTIFLEMLGKNEKFGVVIAVSKAYDSATSFVYAREVDGNEFGGSGKPFQLSRRSNDFSKHEWDNDILTDEKIGLGTILKYEQLGEEYLYTENTKFRPQVSTGIDTIALCFFIFLR